MKPKYSYIYAICGADEYINTLNVSLSYLKKFTKSEILVVTDPKRNESKINHDNIISINTPENLNNHQASIFIKTSLHRYIEENKLYCYIDSDVIAVNENIDRIFEQFSTPITFCSDHCRIHEFSPYAINCGCKDARDQSVEKLNTLYKKVSPDYEQDELYTNEKGRELYRVLYNIKTAPLNHTFTIFRFLTQNVLMKKFFKVNDKFRLDMKNHFWLDSNNNIISHNPVIKGNKWIEKQSDFKFHRLKKYWKKPNGQAISHCACNHLTQAMKRKFNVDIVEKNWQHWNGGVFLFSKASSAFMDHWHDATMNIFDDPEWRTLDQGTLATTAWKFGLENHKLLPIEFNFLVNFYKPEVRYTKEKGFTWNNYKSTFEPYFLHIYQKFGNKNWDIWQIVEDLAD